VLPVEVDRLFDVFFNWPIWVDAFPRLFSGLKVTLALAAVVGLLSNAAGLLLAVTRSLRIRGLEWLVIGYVDTFRSLPALMILVFIYYALPLAGVILGAYPAIILGLSLTNTTFTEEIFRGGIEAIDKGQTDAARALGLNSWQTMRFIVLPQAIRIMTPPLISNAIALVKDTALVSVFAIPELLREARELSSLLLNPSPMMAATFVYVAILIPLVWITRALEIRAAKSSGSRLRQAR
jgi:polar amino acid transport system permease protein